jgi:tRNA nucleotidyltransferase/poly(A) polymerase
MSDYMFMLENHLSPVQNRVLAQIQQAAAQVNVNLFLTGGAIRDMLGGFPIRDLDFTVEGDPFKLADAAVQIAGAKLTAKDEVRRTAELVFPGGITVEVSMARNEQYQKVGEAPTVTPATVYEDLRRRDFTINAMGLSLNRASLGLLIDPTNGLADLEQRELRTTSNRALYDDPSRILRLVRFQVRLGFSLEARTAQQYQNVRLEELEKHIRARQLFKELAAIASEPNPAEVLSALEKEKLLSLFSPALAGPKLNLAGFAKLQKARQTLGLTPDYPVDWLALFLSLLEEKLTPKEISALVRSTGMRKAEAELPAKLASVAKPLERALKSPKLRKASQVFEVLQQAPGEAVLYTYLHTGARLVQDRIRNYFQKYLPASQEVTDKQVAAAGHEPGSAKFRKAKEEMIRTRLDSRPRKIAETPAPEEPPAAAAPAPAPSKRLPV